MMSLWEGESNRLKSMGMEQQYSQCFVEIACNSTVTVLLMFKLPHQCCQCFFDVQIAFNSTMLLFFDIQISCSSAVNVLLVFRSLASVE